MVSTGMRSLHFRGERDGCAIHRSRERGHRMSDENRTQTTPAKKSRRGASPERMREITRARMAKRREGTETASVPTIEVFVTDARYLGLTPSPYQLTLLKGMYGRPLDEQ